MAYLAWQHRANFRCGYRAVSAFKCGHAADGGGTLDHPSTMATRMTAPKALLPALAWVRRRAVRSGRFSGLGILAIPGVGPIVAAGWLVATLTGAAAGAATGGVLGALTQVGVSKEDADVYAEGLRRGGAVVGARVTDADAARLQAVIDRSAVRIPDRAAAYRQSGWSKFDPAAGPYTRDQVMKERSLYK